MLYEEGRISDARRKKYEERHERRNFAKHVSMKEDFSRFSKSTLPKRVDHKTSDNIITTTRNPKGLLRSDV